MNERLGHFLSKIETSKNLPSLPHVLVKLVETCQSEISSLQDISRIISADSYLTAKVLRLVNSNFYRQSDKVVKLDQAVLRMGRNAIKNVAISTAVHQVFNSGMQISPGFDMKRFWRHSLMSAILARMIAQKTAFDVPEQAFLAGMVHDIGRLLLVTYLPDDYGQILSESGDSPSLLMTREIDAGIPHTEVGAWLLNRWNLDSMTADAVLYHHESVARIKDAFPLVKIVFAANIISSMPSTFYSVVISHIFPFSVSEVNDMATQAENEVKEIAESLGIQISEKELSSQDSKIDKEIELIHNVRDISLLAGVLQDLVSASGEDVMLKVIQQGLCILFDFQKILFFLFDDEEDTLSAKIMKDDGNIYSTDIPKVPVNKGESLLMQSMQQKRILSSFSAEKSRILTIMDEQILHLLGKEGMICIPMIAGKESVGLIVVGVNQPEETALLFKQRLLCLLANQTAVVLRLERLKQKQAMKIISERLSASTNLARRVVHEANNPLGIIKNYLKILGSRLGGESSIQNEIQIIDEEIGRIALILRELSNFSQPRTREKTNVNINALLSDIAKIIGESMPATVQIKFHMDLLPSLPEIMSDKNGLKQIFINLIKNAIEAMPGKGNIFIKTAMESEHTIGLSKQSGAISGGSIKIVISDDGPGIPPQVESRIFEPYISTKDGEHSGIGLSVVHNIIKELDGTITYSNAEGNGASFTVSLPVYE